MIITEENKVKHTFVLSEEEWNTFMNFREYCFKFMSDEESNFEIQQDAFVLLDSMK